MDTLKRVVGSLCNVPGNGVVRKEPKGQRVDEDHAVCIEYSFKSAKKVGHAVLRMRAKTSDVINSLCTM